VAAQGSAARYFCAAGRETEAQSLTEAAGFGQVISALQTFQTIQTGDPVMHCFWAAQNRVCHEPAGEPAFFMIN
jgi:hypothetical protein